MPRRDNVFYICLMCYSNHMLHPKERKRDRVLLMFCKLCHYEEESVSPVVYSNKFIKDTAMKLDLVDPALAKDPTLPRTFNTCCPNCEGSEAVFFMSRSGERDSDMALVFLCANEECSHKWLN